MTEQQQRSHNNFLSKRQQYQQEVEQTLTNLGKKGQNALVFYGHPEIRWGLCKSLVTSLRQQQYLCPLLDGEGMRNYSSPSLEKAVIQLRSQLGKGKDDFSCFDFACLYYFKCEYSYQDITSTQYSRGMERVDMLDNSADMASAISDMDLANLVKSMGLQEISNTALKLAPSMLSELMELAKDSIPYAQFLAKLSWFFAKQSEQLQQWWKQRGSTDLQELKDCISHYEVLERLPLFLARDLRRYLSRLKRQAVIFVDGYEAFANQAGRCDWLEEMLAQPNPYLLWVIFSERPIDGIEAIKQIPILPFTDEESLAFLKDAGINKDQICQTILQASQGIPFYLQLGVETWQDIQKQRTPKLGDFAGNLSEVLRKRDEAWDADERRMLQVLSNCRTWDESLFEDLMQQFQLDSWRGRFLDVTASPYVEVVESGVWHFNEMMRQHLQENQPEDWRCSVHSWLFEHYRAKYQDPALQLSALVEAVYHGLESEEPEEAIRWFLEQVQVQQERGHHQVIVSMLQFLLEVGTRHVSLPANQTVGARHVVPLPANQPALAWMLLGKSLVALGNWEKALEALETARKQGNALQLGDSLDAATVEYELTGVYLQLDRTFDAKNAAQRALRLRTAQLGQDSPLVAEVLNRQAEIAASQGEYREAVVLSNRALQLLQSHPDTQPLLLAQLKYTAAVLSFYNNNLDAAEKLCQEALDITTSVGGDEHPQTIACHALMGNIYQQMGKHKYQQAYQHYQLALDAAEISLGPSHPDTLGLLKALSRFSQKLGIQDTADSFAERHNANVQVGKFEETAEAALRLNNLGGSLYDKGQYGKAEPLLKQALQIRHKVLRDNHPDTATSLNNLATLYDSQGRYAEAEPLHIEALQIRRRVLGDNHPDTAKSLNNLAFLYNSQGRHTEAEPLYNQALQIHRQVLGDHHPDTTKSLNNLAALYDSQGRYAEAELLYNQALQIRRQVLGDHHPDTALILNNLAFLYNSQGRHTEAEPLYNQVLQIRRRVLGDNHPNTALSLNNLAGLYYSQGRYAEAEPLYIEALQIRREVLGDHHPDTALSLNNLAGLYESQGRDAEAEPLYIEALQIRRQALGVHHPDTAQSLKNLAGLYESQGRDAEAEPLYIEALQIRRQVLGDHHPDTKVTESNLSRLRDRISD